MWRRVTCAMLVTSGTVSARNAAKPSTSQVRIWNGWNSIRSTRCQARWSGAT